MNSQLLAKIKEALISVLPVTLIVITLGIVMTVYSSYSNQTKEVERTSAATNLAMKVIESLETTIL